MLKRVRKLKSGKVWIGYYYNGRDEEGNRKEIPLGSDLNEARAEWARLERTTTPKIVRYMKELFDRYEREVVPTKAPRTQSDNQAELRQLRKAFDSAPITAITPQVVAQYRDARTAKTRGNREIALLSHVFTLARSGATSMAKTPAPGCDGTRRRPGTTMPPTMSGKRSTLTPARSFEMRWI